VFQYSEKLLAMLLALMLGLSPLQSAMASFTSAFGQEGSTHHQMSDTPCDMDMENSHAVQDGNQCDMQSDCVDHSCASGHCASGVLAVIPSFANFIVSCSTPEFYRTHEEFVDQLFSSLFRPPRV
jgi:hypothetical protein